VPFTVKANIDLAGTPTTNGVKALAAAYPDLDAPDVARMKATGATHRPYQHARHGD
jgi:amidase